MSKLTYVCELGCEEIPARFVKSLLRELKETVKNKLEAHGFKDQTVNTFGTYRRLTIYIDNLDQQSESYTKEHKGPPLNICKDAEGNFLPPAIGFAKKLGLNPEFLEDKDGYLIGNETVDGKDITQVLEEVIVSSFKSLQLPIAMRWGSETVPFIRPVHWILSVLDNKPFPITLFSKTSSDLTYGHRFLGNSDQDINGKEIKIESAQTYPGALKKNQVIINQDDRKKYLQAELQSAQADEDKNLLEEVLYLTEWPTILTGNFDAKYLELPSDVLIECMRKNQKYFIKSKENQLENMFIFAAENVTDQSKTNIIKGNENVLRARLDDLIFFWQEDLKTPLNNQSEKLKKITYQKNMGTLWDKKERIVKLAGVISRQLGFEKETKTINSVAELCKNDLVTQLVFEMPVLQGTVGKLVLEKQTQNTQVAIGIEEHYLPRFATDKLPQSKEGIVIAIADKMDTIVTTIAAGHKPSGSQDPFGLRRALFGIVKIAYEHQLPLQLNHLIQEGYTILGANDETAPVLKEFFEQRLKYYLQEECEYPYDLVETFIPAILTHFNSGIQLLKKAVSMKSDEGFKSLTELMVRVGRLGTKADKNVTVNPALFNQQEETAAWESFQKEKENLNPITNAPEGVFAAIETMKQPLLAYFDDVLVMDNNPEIKLNRLAFLAELADCFNEIGNFEKVAI